MERWYTFLTMEGYRIEKQEGKAVARFDDIEMVPGEVTTESVDVIIEQVRGANMLLRQEAGGPSPEGFGEFQAVLYSDDGVWPDPSELPPIVRDVFHKALEAERARSTEKMHTACHIGVRIQGDRTATKARLMKNTAEVYGRNPMHEDIHFDGNEALIGPISEYLITFSGPTTMQYHGAAELPDQELASESTTLSPRNLKKMAPSLNISSHLRNRLYHLSHRTPHAQPLTLGEEIGDDSPRLFMRFMFLTPTEVTQLSGRV